MADTAVKIPFSEAAAPSTPAASKVVIYAKSDGLMYSKDDAGVETLMSGGAGGGAVATDAIWDAAGDLAVGSGANTAAKLAIGATNGMALQRIGGVVAWGFPPGYEYDYAQITSTASITATSEATANTVVTGNAVTYDGSTAIMVHFWSNHAAVHNTAALHDLRFWLYDGSTSIGFIGYIQRTPTDTNSQYVPVKLERRITPSAAAHTYSIRASVDAGTGVIAAGAGGIGAVPPAFIRITKV